MTSGTPLLATLRSLVGREGAVKVVAHFNFCQCHIAFLGVWIHFVTMHCVSKEYLISSLVRGSWSIGFGAGSYRLACCLVWDQLKQEYE